MPRQWRTRCLKIVDVYRVLDDVEGIVVSLAVSDAALDAASSGPHAEAAWVVIAAEVLVQLALAERGAAKLAAPDDQRLVQADRAASGP